MNSGGESWIIFITRRGKDAAVCGTSTIQSLVIPSVVSENRAAKRMGTGKNIRVGSRASPVFLCSNDVMAKQAQLSTTGKAKSSSA
jgi:hypothetical protein